MKNPKIFQKIAKKTAAISIILSTAIFGTVIFYDGILPDSDSGYDINSLNFSGVKAEVQDDSDEISLKLFGAVPLKTVKASNVSQPKVAISGRQFGIKIFTDGVMVVGMSDLEEGGKNTNPAYSAGIRVGDIIKTLDGVSVQSNEDVAEVIEKSGGKKVTAKVVRKNQSYTFKIRPQKDAFNQYKIGIWVRDSSAGLGTMTFYMPDSGDYAALGHAICDVDTGDILPLSSGEIVGADISSIIKGKNGSAGELCGTFNGDKLGTLIVNNKYGLYGTLYNQDKSAKVYTIADKSEIKVGKAQIVCSLGDSEPKKYDCEIEKVDCSNNAKHSMVIKVTDERLIEKTGGIVQGMSGSPILQNGKLCGAVTHVFINDSTRGYALFAQTMYNEMKKGVKTR